MKTLIINRKTGNILITGQGNLPTVQSDEITQKEDLCRTQSGELVKLGYSDGVPGDFGLVEWDGKYEGISADFFFAYQTFALIFFMNKFLEGANSDQEEALDCVIGMYISHLTQGADFGSKGFGDEAAEEETPVSDSGEE